MKKCKDCGELKNLDSFYTNGMTKKGTKVYRSVCIPCDKSRWKKQDEKRTLLSNDSYWNGRARYINRHDKRLSEIASNTILNSKPITSSELKTLYEDNPQCYYCNDKLTNKQAVFDHKVSLYNNGEHAINNLCVSCKFCNRLKGSMNEDTFIKFLKTIVLKYKGLGL